jgi:gliding motility-associated-like protein
MNSIKKIGAFCCILLYQMSFSQGDCASALTICGNTTFTGIIKTYPDDSQFNGHVSCGNFAHSPIIWLKVTIVTGGSFGFVLTPKSVDPKADLNFFVFGPNVTCGDIGQSIRCSYTSPTEIFSRKNATGLIPGGYGVSRQSNEGNGFLEMLDVKAGESYYIVVMDAGAPFDQFLIDFNGTATIDAPPEIKTPKTLDGSYEAKTCESDGVNDFIANFDLNDIAAIAVGNQNNVEASFYIRGMDAVKDIRRLPNGFRNTESPQKVYIRLTNTVSKCFVVDEFFFTVEQLQTPYPLNIAGCDVNQTGFVHFNLAENDLLLQDNNPNRVVTYHPTASDIITLPKGYVNKAAYQEETIYAKILDTKSLCSVFKPFKLIINKTLPNVKPVQLTQCDIGIVPNDTKMFNLSEASDALTLKDSEFSVKFYVNNLDAQNDVNPLNFIYTNTTNPQTIIAKVTNKTTACYAFTTVDLKVNKGTTLTQTLEKCDDNATADGIVKFNLTDAGFENIGNKITYFLTLDNALLFQNPIAASFINTQPYHQTLYARVENENDCIGINTIELKVAVLPNVQKNETFYLCLNQKDVSIKLKAGIPDVDIINYQYKWSPNGELTSHIEVNKPEIYKVVVQNKSGCTKEQLFTVNNSEIAKVSEVVIDDFTDVKKVTISADGQGVYEYSLDNISENYQQSSIFDNVVAGIHQLYIKDLNGCGILQKTISVLGAPKYFSPNGDGINDSWNIWDLNTPSNSNANIDIFNRFGKLLKQISPKQAGWDGTFNNLPLPADDYWYTLYLTDGRFTKGHFSLIR